MERCVVADVDGVRETTWIVGQTVPPGASPSGRKIDSAKLVAGVESTITISNENAGGFVILDAVVVRLVGE